MFFFVFSDSNRVIPDKGSYSVVTRDSSRGAGGLLLLTVVAMSYDGAARELRMASAISCVTS